MSAEQALAALASDGLAGLDSGTAAQRLRQRGPNALPEPPRRSLIGLFARQFKSPLIGILFAAAVLAVALGHYTDAGVILGVVLVNAVIGAVQEGRAERSMAALRRLAALTARVRRDRRELSIAAHELVPGDVLLLAAGDAIAADARLLEAAQLQVAEAALTGESVPVTKSAATLPEANGLADRHNMVYSGTHITAGRARAVVVATGSSTEVGRIADLTAQAGEAMTPLAERIERFGRWLMWAALVLFVAVLGFGCVAPAAAGRRADGRHQPDGVDGARGPAGGDDDRAGGGHATHGRAWRHRAAARVRWRRSARPR